MTIIPRVIPCLLLRNTELVKTVKFKNPEYIGDPINTVRIFNDKEVDELIILDIIASVEKRTPQLKFVRDITSECFMPLCYGGGIRSLKDIENIFTVGVEKISINTAAFEYPELISEAAKVFGSQSIVVSIDVRKNLLGKYNVFTRRGKKNQHVDPVEYAIRMQNLGAGELLLNSIDRDGTQKGYDMELINKVAKSVTIPVVACGGAGNQDHFKKAIKAGASAVAAGSLFVFQGRHRGVLISYPSRYELKRVLGDI